jgi:thioredoxin 1
MAVTELTNRQFDEFTKKGVAIVDFFADWCMPCLMMAPIMDDLSNKLGKKIKFGKIDVDENHIIAEKFHVHSIPNFVLFKDGKAVERFVGSMPAEDFEEKLKKFI